MVRRWAQELLGYDFAIVHRPTRIMADVDSLIRHYGRIIAIHVGVASILKDRYLRQLPDAYHQKYFFTKKKSKMNIVPNPIEPIPTFTMKIS